MRLIGIEGDERVHAPLVRTTRLLNGHSGERRRGEKRMRGRKGAWKSQCKGRLTSSGAASGDQACKFARRNCRTDRGRERRGTRN